MTITVILIGLVIGAAFLALAIFGVVALVQANKTKPVVETLPESTEHGSSASHPLKISVNDLSLTGREFIGKNHDKYISFDGLIKETSTVNNTIAPHTVLVVGDDISKIGFSDGIQLWINSDPTVFGDELQDFARNNTSPQESGKYPKVSVVAKVEGYSEMYGIISLKSIPNTDGAFPSITLRK